MEEYCKNVALSKSFTLDTTYESKTLDRADRISDLIFSPSKIVSFCSNGTTLKPGTIILTGTPAGVGHSYEPKEYLRNGDEFAVEILPFIGTLTTKFVKEQS